MMTAALTYLADSGGDGSGGGSDNIGWILFLLGPIVYGIVHRRYRNANARHAYESETEVSAADVVAQDEFVEHRKGTRDHQLRGTNQKELRGKE